VQCQGEYLIFNEKKPVWVFERKYLKIVFSKPLNLKNHMSPSLGLV